MLKPPPNPFTLHYHPITGTTTKRKYRYLQGTDTLGDMVKLRVARLLRERHISIYRLGKILRLPTTTVYRLASGKVKRVDLRLLDKLCTALNCEVADLFERTSPRQPRRRVR